MIAPTASSPDVSSPAPPAVRAAAPGEETPPPSRRPSRSRRTQNVAKPDWPKTLVFGQPADSLGIPLNSSVCGGFCPTGFWPGASV
jgi:hypothetical protein